MEHSPLHAATTAALRDLRQATAVTKRLAAQLLQEIRLLREQTTAALLRVRTPNEGEGATMTPQHEVASVWGALHANHADGIAAAIAADERAGRGLWCLVGDDLSFVPADGGVTMTNWGDFLEFAQFVYWVESQPERIHPTHDAAVAYVRSR